MARQDNDIMNLDSDNLQPSSDELDGDLEEDHRQFHNSRLKWIAEISELEGYTLT